VSSRKRLLRSLASRAACVESPANPSAMAEIRLLMRGLGLLLRFAHGIRQADRSGSQGRRRRPIQRLNKIRFDTDNVLRGNCRCWHLSGHRQP
jgi:hypothetical protein